MADIAKTMLLSERTIQRYVSQFELTGSVSPFQRKNGPDRLLTEADEGVLVHRILEQPGVRLKELRQSLLLLRGIDVDESTIWCTLQRLSFTNKKIKHLPIQRSDEDRCHFMAEITTYDPAMFVWLDETGCDKRNAVRQYGYALRGMTPRCYTFKCGSKRYTAIASMSVNNGLEDVYITEGSVNGEGKSCRGSFLTSKALEYNE